MSRVRLRTKMTAQTECVLPDDSVAKAWREFLSQDLVGQALKAAKYRGASPQTRKRPGPGPFLSAA